MKDLSEQEIEKLIMALANGQPSFTKSDVEKVCTWAAGVCAEATLLDLTLQGEILVTVVNGEIWFRSPKSEGG